MYNGLSDMGFTFICDGKGIWGAQELTDRESAIAFFDRQCKLAPPPSFAPTTLTPIVTPGKGKPKPAFPLAAIIGIMMAMILLIAVMVAITVAVVLIRKKEEDELKGIKRRDTTVVSEQELQEVFSPEPSHVTSSDSQGEWVKGPITVVDDVPT